MRRPLVSVIIVNFNGEDLLKHCLVSLAAEKYKRKEVILVDNNSADESISTAKKLYPNIKIVKNRKNLGFAKANNIGVSKARGDYLFLLNNDTQVPKNVLGPLISFLIQNPKVGVVQPRVLLLDDKARLDSIGSFFTKTGFLFHYGFEKKDIKSLRRKIRLFSAKGSAMLIRSSLVEKIGLFDDDYFAYFEESDFCWRVWLSGHEVWYYPYVHIYHKGSATAINMHFPFISFHSFKNRIRSMIKNLELRNLTYILPLHLVISFLAAFSYLITFRPGVALAIVRAMAWNLRHLPSTMNKRKRVQTKIRKLSDRKYLDKVTKKVGPLYYFYLFIGLDKYED